LRAARCALRCRDRADVQPAANGKRRV